MREDQLPSNGHIRAPDFVLDREEFNKKKETSSRTDRVLRFPYFLSGCEPQVILGGIGNKIMLLLALEGFIQLQ